MSKFGNRLPSRSRMLCMPVICMLAGLAVGLANCSDTVMLPDFPEFPPARPFLEEQEQRKRRAAAIAEFRRREQLKFGVVAQQETLAAWLPIYRRGELARAIQPRRNEARNEAFRRFQEQTKAKWLPIQTRILRSRDSKPQRQEIDRGRMRQFQEQTKAAWLPHQTRIFEHRESKEQREFAAFIENRRLAQFPSGTRLVGEDGLSREAP